LYQAVQTGHDEIYEPTEFNEAIKAVDADKWKHAMKKVRESKYEMDDSNAEDSSDVGKPESRKRPMSKMNKKDKEALASEMPDKVIENDLESNLKQDDEVLMHPKECVVNSIAEEEMNKNVSEADGEHSEKEEDMQKDNVRKKTVRRRIIEKSDSTGKGSKKIHRIMKDEHAGEATRKAAREEERRKRISEKQKLYNEIYKV
jgi:transcriptional regulator ATRX